MVSRFSLLFSFGALSMIINWIFLDKFGLSPLIIAVILGILVGNFAHKILITLSNQKVLPIATKQILRLGIILYGFRITFGEIASIGSSGITMAFLMVFSCFGIGILTGKWLGLDRQSSILISSGASICGAAAVMAANSVIKANNDKVGVAVCTVVVFGTIFMFICPILFKFEILGLDLRQIGLYIGISVHEVAHVAAAGASVGGVANDTAIIAKMLRVLMLVPFLLMLGLFFSGSGLKGNIPKFALWFLVIVVFGSILPNWFRLAILPYINLLDTFLLSTAMFALGCGIRKDALKNAGKKPFILATILGFWLIGFGYFLVFSLG